MNILSGKASELDESFPMLKPLRARQFRDQINFNESRNLCALMAKNADLNRLHAMHCRLPKTFSHADLGALERELENEIDEYYFKHGRNHSTLRQVQSAVRDVYIMFSINALKNLDQLPEVASLSFAMNRINGKTSGSILPNELERVWQRLRMYGGNLTTH